MALTLPAATTQDTEYEDFYESTLSLPLGIGDTDVYPVNMPTSAIGFLVIDPLGTNPEAIYYTSKGPNYVRCPSSTDGEGRGVGTTSPQAWSAGIKIGMYSIAEFYEGIVTGKLMRNGFLQSRHFSSAIDPNSWIGTGETWNYVGNNGQKEYQYVTAGDKTTKYQNGMKVRMPRITTMGTMCTDLESTSSQFWRKVTPSGITFLDDFTAEAFIKPESYGAGGIITRYDGTSGFLFYLSAIGQVTLEAHNGGAGNFKFVQTQESVRLSEKIHVAASLDMSGSIGAIYINGNPVPVTQGTGGTNPASLLQAGNLEIGSWNGGTNLFDGEISNARLWSTIRTPSQVLDNMHRQTVGNEVGLVGDWKFNGNGNDSNGNNNVLTSSGGATATTVDGPFNSVEFGIITKSAFAAGSTTFNIFTGTDYNAPAENLSGIGYSAARTPYGFPANPAKWTLTSIYRNYVAQSSPTIFVWYNIVSMRNTAPAGDWEVGYDAIGYAGRASNASMFATLSRANNTEDDSELTSRIFSAGGDVVGLLSRTKRNPISLTSQTNFYFNSKTDVGGMAQLSFPAADSGSIVLFAKSAWI